MTSIHEAPQPTQETVLAHVQKLLARPLTQPENTGLQELISSHGPADIEGHILDIEAIWIEVRAGFFNFEQFLTDFLEADNLHELITTRIEFEEEGIKIADLDDDVLATKFAELRHRSPDIHNN